MFKPERRRFCLFKKIEINRNKPKKNPVIIYRNNLNINPQ